MLVMGFLDGLAGSLGIGIIIPLFSLFGNSTIAETDFITRNLRLAFSTLHIPLTAPVLVGVMILLFALKGLGQFYAKYKTEKLASRFEENLRTDLFTKTLAAAWPYLLKQKVGHLERILLFDVGQATSILNQVSNGILVATSLITYTAVAFKISPSITLFTLLFGAILFFFLKPLFFKTRKLAEEIGIIYKYVAHHIGENIIGAKIIKATAHENEVISKARYYFEKLKNARSKTAFYNYSVGQSLEPIGITFIGLLFLRSYQTADFNIASFAVTVYLIQKMFSFIQLAQNNLQGMNGLIPYIETVVNYRNSLVKAVEPDENHKPFVFDSSLTFQNVTFSYHRGNELLKNVIFTIRKGDIVGIVGSSGSGKTTIVDLLLRLFRPQSGTIKLDGLDIDMVDLQTWRQHIGYVPQDIFLLNDTIENNIRFYDQTISRAQIIAAAKMANIYDFIKSLPNKFQTLAGERGFELSGGQRQRIVLARALARNPDILILDEATSAIDSESEHLIQQAISELKGKVTIIIIAHRLSTITSADQLVVIEKGTIIEKGMPNILLKNKDSHFYKMYNIK